MSTPRAYLDRQTPNTGRWWGIRRQPRRPGEVASDPERASSGESAGARGGPVWPTCLAANPSARGVQGKVPGEKGTFGANAARKTAEVRGYRPRLVNNLLKGPSPVNERPKLQNGATPYRKLGTTRKTQERDGGRQTGAQLSTSVMLWGYCRGSWFASPSMAAIRRPFS